MKRIICIAIAALAVPAFAQQGAPPSDTLKEVTTKGVVLIIAGMEIPVTYTPDGKFTAMDGQVTGDWRIDGEKLCSTSNFSPDEECVAYPLGKKSGDSFEVVGTQGPATVKIN
jgi:hypothetical protein